MTISCILHDSVILFLPFLSNEYYLKTIHLLYSCNTNLSILSARVKSKSFSYHISESFHSLREKERMGMHSFPSKKEKKKKKERWSIPFVPNRKGGVSTRAQDWREMLLTISTGLNKVGNFIRFSSVPPSMVKIKEGWIDKGTRGLARVR